MTDKEPKTFEEFGLIFSEGSGCMTCQDMSCHNRIQSTFNNLEYNVHISMNPKKTRFTVHATENSNVESSDDLIANFRREKDAVSFVCKNFDWFKCF